MWSTPLSPAGDMCRPGAPSLNYLMLLHQDGRLFVILGCTPNRELSGGFPTRFFHLEVPPRFGDPCPGTTDPRREVSWPAVVSCLSLSSCVFVPASNVCACVCTSWLTRSVSGGAAEELTSSYSRPQPLGDVPAASGARFVAHSVSVNLPESDFLELRHCTWLCWGTRDRDTSRPRLNFCFRFYAEAAPRV